MTDTPLYAIFVFFLIISSNYLGEIFPCKIQNVMKNNVFVKHIFAFLTLTFFVVLVDPLYAQTLQSTLYNSAILYILFLVLINTHVFFFVLSMFCLGCIYLLNIKRKEENASQWYGDLVQALYVVFGLSTSVGFLVYMGEKKIEYKKSFDYLTFIFGKPTCRGFSPKTKYFDALFAAFR